MRLAIIYDLLRWKEKALIEEAKSIGAEVIPINIKSSFFEASGLNRSEFGDIALERATSYYRGLHASAIVDASGTPVINSREVLEITGNKPFTILRLRSAGVRVPRRHVSFNQDGAIRAFWALVGEL